jgi:hypothetical protein
MAMKYDTRSCTVTQNWEWVVTGYTPVTSTPVTKSKSFTYYQYWYRYGGIWEMNGRSDAPSTIDGLSYQGGFTITSTAPEPSHWASDGSTYSTPGTASGTYSGNEQSGGDPIYGWGASGDPTHNASPSITYDDGTYAGTLYRDSVSGSPSAPSYNGSYVGQTDSTSTSGTAFYSGDVPAKVTKPDSPTNFRITSQDSTSFNLAWDSANGATTYTVEVYIKGTTTNPVSQNYGITGLTKYIFGLTTGQSYDVKLYAVNSAGNSTPVWMYDVKLGHARPSNFAWTYAKSSETEVNIYASEWNNFLDKINDFREYKGLPRITTFTEAVIDEYIRAIMINQAINIINTLSPQISAPSMKDSEDDIYATSFNTLRDSLNSVT